eukprot:gene21256-8049_t
MLHLTASWWERSEKVRVARWHILFAGYVVESTGKVQSEQLGDTMTKLDIMQHELFMQNRVKNNFFDEERRNPRLYGCMNLATMDITFREYLCQEVQFVTQVARTTWGPCKIGRFLAKFACAFALCSPVADDWLLDHLLRFYETFSAHYLKDSSYKHGLCEAYGDKLENQAMSKFTNDPNFTKHLFKLRCT